MTLASTRRRALRTALIVVSVGLVLTACEQKQSQESRPGRKHTAIPDTGRINAALREQAALPAGAPEKEWMLRSILKDAIAAGYNDRACGLLMDFGTHHAEHGNLDSTLHYYTLARPFCNLPLFDKTLPATYLTEFGAYYHSLRGDYVAAHNNYYKALAYLKAANLTESELTINLYYYLVGTQEKLGRHEQALVYLKEAERLAVKLKSTQAFVAIQGSFGDYYFERRNYPLAEKYYDRALHTIDSAWNSNWDANIPIVALVGKASALTATGNAARAIPFLQRALKIARDNQIDYSEAGVSFELGVAYNALGHYNEAIRTVAPALQKLEKDYGWKLEDGYRVLMVASEGLGQYKQALAYQRKLQALSDSLLTVEKSTALNDLELKYQAAQKDKEIASKQLQIARQKNRLARQNTLIGGISAVALLAVLILLMLYKSARHKQGLQALEIGTMRRQQEINLLRASIEGEEQERKRLSRELHDGTGSMIFSAIMRASMLKKKDPASITAHDFDDMLRLLEQTGSEIRKTAHNMMPDVINQQTLLEAVEAYCETVSYGTPVKIDVQFYGPPESFSADIKLVLYRIIQELVHNVVKHARATHAIVQMVLNDEQLSITVEDNGKGFVPGNAHRGLGLKNLESRIRSLSGEFQIESTPGSGTTIYMEFDRRYLGYGEGTEKKLELATKSGAGQQ